MITGSVTVDLEAIIPLVVRGPDDGKLEIDAVADTGFDGWISLPPSLIAELGLPWRQRGRALLADCSECVFDTYESVVQAAGLPNAMSSKDHDRCEGSIVPIRFFVFQWLFR